MTAGRIGGANKQNPEANSNAECVGIGDEMHYADSSDRQADQALASGILSPSVDALVAR